MYPPVIQVGIPGGQELVIIAMIFVMLAVPVVTIALIIKFLVANSGADDERIEQLEREVEELREERRTAADPDDKLE